MTNKTEPQIAEIGVRLLDHAYLAWREAASEAEVALRAWLDGFRPDRDTLWFVYLAALDREEAAALDLQRLAKLARPCVRELSPEDGRGAE